MAEPVVATFSIVACDLAAGQWGVATQSKFLAVGSVVPWAAAHVGAVATQSYANPRYGPWELSFDRANVARVILQEFGLSNDRLESVVGRSDTEPFFVNEPYLSANQRVSILLIYERPPVPVDLKP